MTLSTTVSEDSRVEGLLKAALDFLAAVLARLGFTGRPRRRAGIRQDLELLHELEKFPHLGPGTWAHQMLSGHIEFEIAKLAGIEFPRRNIPWGSVVLAAVVGFPLGYVTYVLNKDGFNWWSLIPGIVSGLMLFGLLGLLLAPEEKTSEGQTGPSAGVPARPG